MSDETFVDDAPRADKPGLIRRTAVKVTQALTRPKVQSFPLQTEQIAGPLQFTKGGTFMWFLLGAQEWDFLTLPKRRALWDQQTFRYGRLAETSTQQGRPIRLRVTTRPYPSFEFARSLDLDSPGKLPQVAGGESWMDYLAHAQRRLRSTGLDQKIVALGVWIGPTPPPRVRRELVEGTEHPLPETLPLLEQILQVERIMAGRGFNARRATARDMAFLFHRGLSMGVPVPSHSGAGGERWEPTDLAEFTDRRAWIAEPFGSTVKIMTEVNGAATSRYAAVLSVGVMPSMTWPESGAEPWIQAASRLPFPVEVAAAGALVKGSALEQTAAFEQNRAEGIRAHYAEHNVTPPPAVQRAIEAAAMNLDEITEGDSRTAARFTGAIRLAVYANSENDALSRARDLIDFYGERLNIPLGHTSNQAQVLREFVPAEPRVKHGWQRRMPVRYLAAAMPNVDSELGTPSGPYFAYGSGSARRAARFDMHYGPEVLNKPGLFTLTAEPGGGKSVLIGALAYSAARRGEHTIILDPSGPLAALCRLPELAPFSRVLDLTTSEAGTLSPYQMIPEPMRASFEDDQGRFDDLEYDRAVRRGRAERQQLMFDVLRMWLPPALIKTPGVDVLLREGIRFVADKSRQRSESAVGRKAGYSDTQTNPRWVLEWFVAEKSRLERRKATGSETKIALLDQLIAEITTAAEFPLGELVMPDHSEPIAEAALDDKTLVVVTMPGLNPPPEAADRDFWGSEERYTQPLLHLAAFFASKFIYARPRSERKNVFLDENQLMGQWGSGRAFFVRLGRDSRKWNTAVGAASQHPDDHLSIGRLDALMGSAFVGRLTNHDTAVQACRLLQCPEEYAPVIEGLSPTDPLAAGEDEDEDRATLQGHTGEMIWRDPLGRLGKIRVDMDWHPSLRAALQTTPGRRRPKVDLTPQPTPFIDQDLFDGIPAIEIDESVPDEEAA